MRALTFRTTVTLAVLGIVTTLALCLIAIQAVVLRAAAKAAASAQMDVAAASTLSALGNDISELKTVVRILAASPFLADSNQRSETGGAVGLFETALRQLPQADSIYVGYDNGCWLQVRRIDNLTKAERDRIDAPVAAASMISLILPSDGGELPLRRVFRDASGNKIEERVFPDYGYDVRKREWFLQTLLTDRTTVSRPYPSYSLRSPVITLSTPLRGKVTGVIAVDLKLDTFSDLVYAQRPGAHGRGIIFDASGGLIADHLIGQLFAERAAHSDQSSLPNIRDDSSSPVAEIIRGWNGADQSEGYLDDDQGRINFFRLTRFPLGDDKPAYLLLVSREDDFAGDIRKLQHHGVLLAVAIGGCFVPMVWLFGGRISRSLTALAKQASQIHALAEPEAVPLTSRLAEVQDLGAVLHATQRAIWSFGHFMPREIVRSILDGSLSTDLGGSRQEVTLLFTDVENFTGIAERAEPDQLMRQTSRHFTALGEIFLGEGGTIDKYIGDAIMVFWNAPRPQPDHVMRACRAALAAKTASEELNTEFIKEGLSPFVTRIGIHVGDVVVGNLGSAERMDYTALGASVNLASRLEGLNKDYGTSILASEAVCRRAEPAFLFKPIASIIAKGMTVETQVYELLGVADAGLAAAVPLASMKTASGA